MARTRAYVFFKLILLKNINIECTCMCTCPFFISLATSFDLGLTNTILLWWRMVNYNFNFRDIDITIVRPRTRKGFLCLSLELEDGDAKDSFPIDENVHLSSPLPFLSRRQNSVGRKMLLYLPKKWKGFLSTQLPCVHVFFRPSFLVYMCSFL